LEADCPLTIIPDRGATDWRVVFRLLTLCREKKIELLQAHDYKSNALALLLSKLHRMKLATMLHGWTDMTGRMPLYKRIDQSCLPWFKTLICVSEDLVDECRKLRIPDTRIHLVHNAIDTEQYSRRRARELAKQELSLPSDCTLIGTVGRLSPEKGILGLLECVERLHRDGKPCLLWIAGDGPQRPEIEKRIEELGLQASVRLMGQLRDTRTFFEAMDLFVLNSVREGLPNVVLEAMALGAPVVATNIAGIPSLIRDRDTGRLIEPGDAEQLYQAISSSIASPDAIDGMSRRARGLIERDYSFEQRMRRVASIYDGIFA
jgi:glycosyltransferase involved in cell wall biosynthesis